MQDSDSAPRSVPWYRTPLDSATFKSLHERSDLLGGLQTISYLGLMILTGALTFYSAGHGPIWLTLLLLFTHGTVCSFQPNAVHELGHGTVFKTKALNAFFVRIFGFINWNNFEAFQASHSRHHRYTLHQPDDLEVVLPAKVLLKSFFLQGFLVPMGPYRMLEGQLRVARGKLTGQWEQITLPEGSPERKATINWARTMLIGHGLILAVSLYFHLWMLPVLTSLTPFYGGWLFFLCNNTQHIGLQDDVPDFRLCCRTFTLNPIVQFLYWHMNFHIEHHMYAAVPCYRLGRLHRLIKHDLAPCPHGLIATWQEIAAIQKIQETNPDYQHLAPLPSTPTVENRKPVTTI
jgi:fatty acid desaturase